MKIRIGKAYNFNTREELFQLQFKLDEERTYNGLSYDVFKTELEAKEALEKHQSCERKYEYYVSIEKVKRKVKGNRIHMRKTLAYHVLSAPSDLPSSIIWIKTKHS